MPPLSIAKLELRQLVEITAASIEAGFESAYGARQASPLAHAA
jgi:hypothetical protein